MIKIELDLSGINFDKVPQNLDTVVSESVRDTVMAVHAKWQEIAQRKLRTTLIDYLSGLNADESVQYPYNGNYGEGLITLVGKVANSLEQGWKPFDMKAGFERSPKTHRTADNKGWYAHVPFRHRTPGTSGVAVGGQAMPADIYVQAKNLKAGDLLLGTETSHPPQTSWTGYQHKNGLYEGMQRVTKQYDSSVGAQYATFRTVSSKSDPKAWWHPGYRGAHVMNELEPFAQDTLNKVFNSKLGG